MTLSRDTPTPDQARQALDKVLARADLDGRRPSVLAVARELGLPNSTFRRAFPDIAGEVGNARRTPKVESPESPAATEHAKLLARNATLRRDNQRLSEHLDLAIANVVRLTLTVRQLQGELEAVSGVSRISPGPRRGATDG